MDSRAAISRLSRFHQGRARPCPYDRSRVRVGIVHIGLGAFARAHLAAYTDELLAQGHLEWGICGISMRSAAVRDALEPQDGLYCLIERGSNAIRIIGSVVRCLVEPEAPAAVRLAIQDPAIRIVTLTVTESGYGLYSPTIQLLTDALAMRRAEGWAPFSVICLDNIAGTGSTVRAQVVERARGVDPSLAAWIEDHVAFPRAMVDRMVPRTTETDRRLVRQELGVIDAWPVVAEPYSQWLLEDDFPTGRPAWENAGVTFVSDVRPWEAIKLRVLNAGHLALACLGMLMGYSRVSGAARDLALNRYVEQMLLEEVGPALSKPKGFDLEAYVAVAIERFSNPTLGYLAAQTVSGGSLKLHARLVPSVVALGGNSADRLALAFAAWIRVVAGPLAKQVADPNLERIQDAASNGPRDPASVAGRVLATQNFFEGLVHQGRFSDRVCELCEVLAEQGVVAALSRVEA